MNEQFTNSENLLNEPQEASIAESSTSTGAISESETVEVTPAKTKRKLSKKAIVIIAAIVVVAIAVVIALLVPSRFERVWDKCVQIAGYAPGDGDYFTIDTYPERLFDMYADQSRVAIIAPSMAEDALEAIQYANEALGFNGSVWDKMMNTNALMGRQSVETDKYRVSWTYHPDDGLEVTYEQK